jgi:protein lifeguard
MAYNQNFSGNPDFYPPGNPYGGAPGYPPQGQPSQGYPQGQPSQGYPQGYPQYPMNMAHPPVHRDLEMNNMDDNDIHHNKQLSSMEASLRVGFVRKVYGILTCQLLVTVFIAMISMNSKGFQNFQRQNVWLFYVCVVFTLVISIALACFSKLARKSPINYILLGIFTFCQAYMVGFICSFYKSDTVVLAAILTLGIVSGLTAYACYTKTDFTYMGGILFAMSFMLMFFGFALMFIRVPWMHVLYSVLSLLLFSVYLIYDTQLIMGGKKHELSIDDYVIGALMLYIDIMTIFLHLLRIVGFIRD